MSQSQNVWVDLHHFHLLDLLRVRVTTCFNDLGLSRLEFEHPTFRMRGERSNQLRRHRGYYQIKK